MMRNQAAIKLLVAFAGCSLAANGPALSTGPVDSGNFIILATSTLHVPSAPNPIVGNTVLWVGMGTSNGDLIQGINNNYPPDNLGDPCSNLGGNWCVAAYTIQAGSGPRANSKPGDLVNMTYVYNRSTGLYDQSVAVNGRVVSTISSNSGQALGFGSATECTTKPCGLVPAHSWSSTTIVLNKAYPGYSNTRYLIDGASGGGMTTPDGGKTWKIDTFYIPAWDCTTL